MVQHITDRVTIGGQAVDRATVTGIKVASAKSGVSFQYLLAKAAQESSLKTDAQAEGSSAAGLFQFTKGTWLEMVKRYGADTGLNDLAQKILTGTDGRALVSDKDIESRILSLREDPEVSALMAAHYARDNAQALEGVLGREPDASDLYLAHFLGANGAGLLLGTAADKPTTTAANLMPAAAKANRAVFYDGDGNARSAADVVKLVRDRFSSQLSRFAAASPQGAPVVTAASAAPQTGTVSTPFDLKGAMKTGNPSQMMLSWYMMEQLAQLIAAKPMAMSDESGAGADQSVSSGGLQGGDWASAMTSLLTRDTGKTPGPAAPAEAAPASASRAYDQVRAHTAAFVNRRKDSHS